MRCLGWLATAGRRWRLPAPYRPPMLGALSVGGMVPRSGRSLDVKGQQEVYEQQEEWALCTPLRASTGEIDPWGGAHIGLHCIHAGGKVCL